MDKIQRKSHLSILKHFVCIADRCPYTCCHGWDIAVDDATYQRWQVLSEDTVQQTLPNSSFPAVVGEGRGRKIAPDAKGNCSSLSDCGLCSVQQQLGHEYLPRTCREYPRIQIGREAFRTDSAYLSCPEIARLVVAERNFKTLFSSKSASSSEDDVLAKIIQTLEKLSNKVLPIEVVPPGISLFYLASNVLELMHCVQQGQLHSALLKKIANESSKVTTKKLKSLEKAYQAGKLQSDEQGGILFWSFVVTLAECNGLQDFKPLLEKHGLAGLYAGQDEISQHASYQKLKSFIENPECQPELRKRESALRSYLIVKLRNHGFPHEPAEGNFLVNLLDSSSSLATIKLWMWLLMQEQKTISEDELVKIIYKVERAFVHDDYFYQQINTNPQLLDMSTYIGCFADLG